MSELSSEERIQMDESSYGVSGLRGPDNRELYVIEHPNTDSSVGTLIGHPGAMWREPRFDRDGREAWVVVLPNRAGCWWTTWTNEGVGMWQVIGNPAAMTVTPSINAGDGSGPGNWHGWIKNGVMTP